MFQGSNEYVIDVADPGQPKGNIVRGWPSSTSLRPPSQEDDVRYSITDTPQAQEAIHSISGRMATSSKYQSCTGKLQLRSMRESFDLTLLTRFYEELMIPNFPLEDERDDLEDWVWCFDPSMQDGGEDEKEDESKLNPYFDVLILVLVSDRTDEDGPGHLPADSVTILGGIAFDYFRQAQTGLLSYMVVSDDFRRLGIVKAIHPIACLGMQTFHQISNTDEGAPAHTSRSPTIRAILAETNTVDAGDAPTATIRKRHEILYRLGYRHLKFPYVQPPLNEGEDTFDDIMLLVYVGDRETGTDDSAKIFDSKILYDYVVDFFHSITGYDRCTFEGHWYFRLVDWYAQRNPTTEIASMLPWEDITEAVQRAMEDDQKLRPDTEPLPGTLTFDLHQDVSSERHVVVVGAGIAGLVATVRLAEEYLKNLEKSKSQKPQSGFCITLVEAHPFVGGRIRTVVTDPDSSATSNSPFLISSDANQNASAFAPWPVAIGAEFVHGVDSMVTDLIQLHDEWEVEETFDLCVTPDEYPSTNEFLRRERTISLTKEQRNNPHVQIFLGGECHPVEHGFFGTQVDGNNGSSATGVRMKRLIRRAQELWQNVQSVRDQVHATLDKDANPIIRDMSLEQFIRDQLENDDGPSSTREDYVIVEQILESMFSNTWSTSNKYLGVHEVSREDWNWNFTQTNFRTQQCFNELLAYYVKRIETINQDAESSLLRINIEVNQPVKEIGSFEESHNRRPIRVTTKSGNDMDCDRVIVTIPLAALKAQTISFQDDYLIPRQMQDAIDTVNMFSGMKAHMLLKVGVDIEEQPKIVKTTELFFCPGELFSQVWLRRNDDTVFLTGFCLANCRDQLLAVAEKRGLTKDETARHSMLEQLQRMFEPSESGERIFVDADIPSCSAFALHDWSDDEYILGAYSSPSVGGGWQFSTVGSKAGAGTDSLKTSRDSLSRPIKDAIWLAGEHVCTEASATVQSAMMSGNKAAMEVMQSLLGARTEF